MIRGPLGRRRSAIVVAWLAACAGQDVSPPVAPLAVPPPVAPRDAPVEPEPMAADAGVPAVIADGSVAVASGAPEVWLKGSTHVHARPSGDSSEPVLDVVRWYEAHHYDFIALTDHNQVTEIDPATSTAGQVAVRAPAAGLIVLAGIELTHNPTGCLPAGDPKGRCRIHVNLLGVTARPTGKVVWANRHTHDRLAKYEAALVVAQQLGGLFQLNHPQWFWGMNAELLTALAQRGVSLVEIANQQFATWSKGDKDHPSMESLWDAVLVQGLRVWGVASDDAHDYGAHGGRYPAGGGWVVVKARREPQAILDALATGRFYASTGVVLQRAEVDGGALVVEVAPDERGQYTIDFIEHGQRVERVAGRRASRPVPATGYVRAVVTRDNGDRAWVQPARAP